MADKINLAVKELQLSGRSDLAKEVHVFHEAAKKLVEVWKRFRVLQRPILQMIDFEEYKKADDALVEAEAELLKFFPE